MEVAPQHLGVAPHHARGHGETDVGKDLVPVEPEELETVSVQEETLQLEAPLRELLDGGDNPPPAAPAV